MFSTDYMRLKMQIAKVSNYASFYAFTYYIVEWKYNKYSQENMRLDNLDFKTVLVINDIELDLNVKYQACRARDPVQFHCIA